MEDSNEESKLWGVSVRSWAALFVIMVCTFTICYLGIRNADSEGAMILASGAIGFLFGAKRNTVPSTINQ